MAEPSVAHIRGANAPASKSTKPFLVATGMASNLGNLDGVAAYGQIGVRIWQIDVSAGATYPTQFLGQVRLDVVPGRLDGGPILTLAYLGDVDAGTPLALAGGFSLGLPLYRAAFELGLRLDAQASFDLHTESFAFPIITSSYLRF